MLDCILSWSVYGCSTKGSELGAKVLADSCGIEKCSISASAIPLEAQDKSESACFEEKLDEITDIARRLFPKVNEALSGDNNVLVLGGDHSIALGSVAGTLQYDHNAAVIWFDAHGDVNTEATSPSGNIHGMPVAALMGLCSSKLNDIATVKLNPQNIFWLGVRDLDEGERKIAEQLNLKMYSTEYIHKVGMRSVIADIAAQLQKRKISTLHLSFDIDGMDPTIVAATGTKVHNGLLQCDFEEMIKAMSDNNMHWRVLDFVEYNPLLDTDGETLVWCKQALKLLTSLMKK